jgi:glucose-6-phosphate isomerase
VGIYLDYSKNRITDETLKLLLGSPSSRVARAHRRHVQRREDQCLGGRAVLHVALRAPRGASIFRRRPERGARGA